MKLKELILLLSVPLTLILIYLSFALLWELGNLPEKEASIEIVKNLFAHYGLEIIFISALIEGFLLIGQYFPGGFVIFLGVIAAGNDLTKVSEVIFVASSAFILAYYGNYLLGKYGWYHLLIKFGLKKQLEKAQIKLKQNKLRAFAYTYWEPNLASLTATAAGILKISTKEFFIYSSIATLFWSIFWGIIVYFLGEQAINMVGTKYILFIFGAWCLLILLTEWVQRRKNKVTTHSFQSETPLSGKSK